MVFERIREVRKYRHLTQDNIAEWFNISKQSWSRKERGTEGGLGPEQLKLFIEKTKIDARYIFGQIDSLEEADLTRQTERKKDYSDLVNEIQSLKTHVQGVKESDPVAYRVSINNALHRVVEKIQYLDAGYLERVDALIQGFFEAESQRK